MAFPIDIRKSAIEFALGESGTYIEDSKTLGETLEKGGKAVPVGTIKDNGQGSLFIKTDNGWKYHGRANAKNKGSKEESGGKEGAKQEESKGQSKGQEEDGKEGSAKESPDKAADKLGAPEKEANSPKVDINERFAAYARYTKAVISGKFKSCLAYGSGGVGKTYTVLRELDAAGKVGYDEDLHSFDDENVEEDENGDLKEKEKDTASYDYVKITGKATPVGLFRALHEHNGKLLIFDDCDEVLKNKDSINILKGALDTSGDGAVSYATGKPLKGSGGEELPQRFKFTGRVIFVSNLSADQVPQPLKSRSLRVDLSMNREQTIKRIEHIATNPKTGELTNLNFPGTTYKPKDMKDVLGFVNEHKEDFDELSVRTIGAMLAIKQQASEEGVDWKKEAEHMVFSKSEKTKELLNIYKGFSKSHVYIDLTKSMTAGSTTGTDTLNKKTTMEGLKKEDMEKGGKGSGRHISDMSHTEVKEWAKKLGIKTEGHTPKSLREAVLDKNIDKQLKEFKEKQSLKKSEALKTLGVE